MFALGRAARAISNEFGGGQYSNHRGYAHGYTGCYGKCRQIRAGVRGNSGYGYDTPCVHRGPPPDQNIVGQLVVTVVSITTPSDGILSLTHNRIEDPFIIVQLAGDYSRTRTLKGPIFGSLDWPSGEEMFFRDTLGFPIWASHSTEDVKFFVYGKKKHGEEKYLASATIDMARVLTQGYDEVVLPMLSRSLMPYGQIHVRLRYERRGASPESRPTTPRVASSASHGIPIPAGSAHAWCSSGSPNSYGSTIIVYNADEDAFIAVPEKKEGDEGSSKGGSPSPSSSQSSSFRSSSFPVRL